MPALDQKFSASQTVCACHVCVWECMCVPVYVYLWEYICVFVCLDLLAIDFDLYLSLVLAHLRFSDCF